MFFFTPLPSFLLQCIMQKSQISFSKEKKKEQGVHGPLGFREKLRHTSSVHPKAALKLQKAKHGENNITF